MLTWNLVKRDLRKRLLELGFRPEAGSYFRRQGDVELWISLIPTPKDRLWDEDFKTRQDVRLMDVALDLYSEELRELSQDEATGSHTGQAQLSLHLCHLVPRMDAEFGFIYVLREGGDQSLSSIIRADLERVLDELGQIKTTRDLCIAILSESESKLRRSVWTMRGVCAFFGRIDPTLTTEEFLANYFDLGHPIWREFGKLQAEVRSGASP